MPPALGARHVVDLGAFQQEVSLQGSGDLVLDAASLANELGARRSVFCFASEIWRSFLVALCAFIVGLLADISRRKPVPGANDNASAVAALLGLGQDLARRPPGYLRVLLVSTGSEETMLEGMDASLRRHHGDLEPAQTLVICLDQIGWERLVLREKRGSHPTLPDSPGRSRHGPGGRTHRRWTR